MTAGIYARISLDRHDGEGVARQLADCHELAAVRGWDDPAEYVDNDISAFRARRRPEYDRLLADLHAGHLTAIVAYHPDRLYRRPADLEAFIDAVQAAGADVATVKAGDVDLSTASGRMVARILGAVSRQESERIGERVSRAKRERAAQGRPAGGGMRPFGLTADRTALVADEAEALRRAAAEIVAGSTLAAEIRRMNAAGLRTVTGAEWTIGDLNRTLTSPHIAGLRAYHGEIVGPAAWPAILDRGTWDLLRAEAVGRRRGRPASGQHLLTGFLSCSRCNRTLWVNGTPGTWLEYRCSPKPTATGHGCGRLSITAPGAEDFVIAQIGEWLRRPAFLAEYSAFLAYGSASAAGVAAEIDEIERRQVALAQRWADGSLSDGEYDAARAVLAERLTAAQAQVGPRRAPAPVPLDELARMWQAMTVPERREVIPGIAACPIPVLPGRDAGRRVVPVADRLLLRPVWET